MLKLLADDVHGMSCPGESDADAVGDPAEANGPVVVAPHEREEHDVILLPLVVGRTVRRLDEGWMRAA